jgi:uncharacterized protein (DUF3084 family)
MFWTVLALISLVVLGGFISYYGDLQGRRWGKKRVSWFGLRPKYTAVLITSLTGAFVAFLSIVTLLLVAPAIRNVVLQGEHAIQENKALNSQLITQRIENERSLLDLNTRLDATQSEFMKLGERYSKLLRDMDNQKRLANDLKAKNSELDKDYITLQEAQKLLKQTYRREQNKVIALKKQQGRLARLNKTVEDQIHDAGDLNSDLGKENIRLTRLKGELEGKVNTAQDSLAMLQETNAMLKSEGEQLQEKNASLIRQNLALYETNRRSEDYNRELRLKNDELVASNTNLRQQQDIYLAGLRDASETVGAIRQGKLILRAGGELARRVLPAHSRPEAVKRELLKLLADAHYSALNYKAGIGENGRAVRIISKRIISQAGITNKNEEDSINAIIDELTAQDIPVVIIANAVNNSLVGEQVIIELTPFAVKPTFEKGEKVAQSVIDTKQPIEQIVDAIVEFLRRDVRTAAIKEGVIATIDPETGTQQVGTAVARDLVALTEKVRKAGGKVLLTAYSAQTMTSADPLMLTFDVRRINNNNAPEILITSPGSRGKL